MYRTKCSEMDSESEEVDCSINTTVEVSMNDSMDFTVYEVDEDTELDTQRTYTIVRRKGTWSQRLTSPSPRIQLACLVRKSR